MLKIHTSGDVHGIKWFYCELNNVTNFSDLEFGDSGSINQRL